MSDLLQKITDVKVWHIRVPVVSTRSHGIGDIKGGFEVVLLRLTTEGGQEGKTKGEPVELSLIRCSVGGSILGSVVFVHLSGNEEGGEDDFDTEGEEGNDPGDLEGTKGSREPSVSTVTEEVGTLISGGSAPVLSSDSRRNSSVSGVSSRENT